MEASKFSLEYLEVTGITLHTEDFKTNCKTNKSIFKSPYSSLYYLQSTKGISNKHEYSSTLNHLNSHSRSLNNFESTTNTNSQ